VVVAGLFVVVAVDSTCMAHTKHEQKNNTVVCWFLIEDISERKYVPVDLDLLST